jgi:hypothetical protein
MTFLPRQAQEHAMQTFEHEPFFTNSVPFRFAQLLWDARRPRMQGKKTALFEPFIYKMHYFTKTGSG